MRRRLAHVRTNRSIPDATVIPVLVYPDVREAVAWLEDALGFVERVRIGDSHRSQLRFGDGALIVADVRHDQSPPRAGESTHLVMLRVDAVDALCERARGRGAHMLMEPTSLPYGERQCILEDPVGGHRWTLSETIEDVAPEAWGGALVSRTR